ncbi:MAG: ATP-binding cassette domain-containing protein, partial [Rhodococcus sp.]
MATVHYAGVSHRYPGADSLAVDTLELDIADGEFIVLVGPSGCGKSTSLRMLAGLESVESGHIDIGGVDVTSLAPRARDVAMVFQNYALYPNMTVGDNMGFALRNAGMSKADTAARVLDAARMLELEPLLDRKPGKLSGGQRQRVAMGRAIVRQPKVFCMDEPLSNLDAKLRVSTRAQIAGLQKRLGTTTVYVTHDQVEAMTIGSPGMNLVDAPVHEGAAVLGDVRIPVPSSAGYRVVVGVRPESWELVGEHAGGLRLTVELIEELGAESFVYASAPNADGQWTTSSGRISVRV